PAGPQDRRTRTGQAAAPGAARARRGADRGPKKSLAAPGHPARERREGLMQTVTELGPRLGIAPTCAALELARASYYRGLRPPVELPPRPAPARAPPAEERQAVLDVLHEPRLVDLAPAETDAAALDDARHRCSERTR